MPRQRTAPLGRRTGNGVRAAGAALMTAATLDELRDELERLRARTRVEIAARLREARAFGSGSNNDEFHAVREEQLVLEARIASLEESIARAEVVDPGSADSGVAVIWSIVLIEDLDSGAVSQHRLASAHHSLGPDTISAVSPVGQALVGATVGTTVTVDLANGNSRSVRLAQVTTAAQPTPRPGRPPDTARRGKADDGPGRIPIMDRDEQAGTAFVLSGGASLGAIQVGMLRALYERGIAPNVIVGTSAGALNGAFIASRPQTTATADALAAIWRDLRRGQVFPLNPLTGLLGFLGSRDHLVPASGLRRLIRDHVEHELLEEMPIPLHVVAVDVLDGHKLRLSRGPVLDAVLASAAIPGVLPPVPWRGRPLMDGGVANNTPISHAVALGARRIYVLPTGHACALEEPPDGALGMALHAISLLTHRRLVDDIERHRAEVELIVLPPPCPLDVQPIDFGHADELIDVALVDAGQLLDRGGGVRAPAEDPRTWPRRPAEAAPLGNGSGRGGKKLRAADAYRA